MKKIFIMICVIMLICVSPNIIMASTESNSLMEDTPQQDIYNQDTLVKNISTNQEDSQTNISMTNELDDLSTEKKQQNNQNTNAEQIKANEDIIQQSNDNSSHFIVSDEGEFKDAVSRINTLAKGAQQNGQEMQNVVIELKSNILLSRPVDGKTMIQFNEGANLKILGNGRTISLDRDKLDPTTNVPYCLFSIVNTKMILEDVILDTKGNENFHSQAFRLTQNSQLIIEDGTMITGTYALSKASIYCVNSSVIMNGGSIYDNVTVGSDAMHPAGAIQVVELTNCESKSEFIMNGGEIYNNSNLTESGGAISAIGRKLGNAFIVINGGEIYNNYTASKTKSKMGGAIYVNNGSLKIYNGKIHDNTAQGGGAVYVTNGTLEMTNGEIYSNKAFKEGKTNIEDGGEGGGAFTIKNNSTATLTGGKIYNNYSDMSGGAIQVFVNSDLTMSNMEIYNNVAEAHAGAICVADGYQKDKETKSILTISNSKIYGNLARSRVSEDNHVSDPVSPGGGAIYAHEYCEINLKDGTEIYENTTENYGNGGAVYVCFGGELNMDGGVIRDNISVHHGGAIYLDGADEYDGIDHGNLPDDGFASGSLMNFNDGLIMENIAYENGGGIFAEGSNIANDQLYRGGACLMNGGVITHNHAYKQGGGVYLESADSGVRASSLRMSDGAIYFNIAGKDGNTSSNADMAGAEIYADGKNTHLTVLSAKKITEYIQNADHKYVPSKDRNVWFTSWFDDYSDLDHDYGKKKEKIGKGYHSGRYMSSQTIDRIAYEPKANTTEYKALILDRSTQLSLEKIVSGESIQNELYTFEVTCHSLPDLGKDGVKYPIEFNGSITSHQIGTLDSGQKYIQFDKNGTAKIQMKANDSIHILSLPLNTSYTIKEVDSGSASKVTINSNIESDSIDYQNKMIKGKTPDSPDNHYQAEAFVSFDNIYEKEGHHGDYTDPIINGPSKPDSNEPTIDDSITNSQNTAQDKNQGDYVDSQIDNSTPNSQVNSLNHNQDDNHKNIMNVIRTDDTLMPLMWMSLICLSIIAIASMLKRKYKR